MRRNIEKDLKKWKDDRHRKPLLLRGARQVGKTYIVEKFARDNFSNYIEINFERKPELCQIFDTLEPKRIVTALELATNSQVVPGETLVFLDEIQECPKAIMALRYFKEEMPELHLIGAGSLLEFVLNDENFRMPVGRIQFLYLYPLSFFEFLTASGNEKLRKYLNEIDLSFPIEEAIHQRLLDLIREYMILGGMPAIIHEYLLQQNVQSCQEIQTDLLATYRADFGKYARTSQHKYLQLLFERAPGLVAQWFKYSKN